MMVILYGVLFVWQMPTLLSRLGQRVASESTGARYIHKGKDPPCGIAAGSNVHEERNEGRHSIGWTSLFLLAAHHKLPHPLN
jgi:hypothetical protein